MLKMTIIGHVGKDAEIKELSDGKVVINFSVAHSTKRRDPQTNEEISNTTWVNCSFFKDSRERASVAQYIKRGGQVYVEGTPMARAYNNKSGNPEAALECRVIDLQLLGASRDNEAVSQTSSAPANSSSKPRDYSNNSSNGGDDLPF